MAKQIDLLFGVKGGASVSGESGALIKAQIEGIVKELNDSKIPALQFNIDQSALKKQVAEIKNLLKDVDFTKLGSSSSQDKKLTVKAAGNIHNLRKAYSDLAMSKAKVNKVRLDMKSLDYTPQLETLKIAISEFDKAWSNVSYRSGNVLPYSSEKITAENLLEVAEAAKAVQAAMMEATTASKANGNEVKTAFKEEASEAKKAAADIKKAIGNTKNAYGNLGSIQASFNKKILGLDKLDDTKEKTKAQTEIDNFKKLLAELSDGNGGFKALNLEDKQMVDTVNRIAEAWNRVKVSIDEATTASKANGNQVKTVASLTEKLGVSGLGFLTGKENDQFDLKKYKDIVKKFNQVGEGLIFSGNNNQYAAMADAIENADALIKTMRGEDGIIAKLDPDHVEKYGKLAEYLKIIQQNAGRIKSSGDDLGMEKVVDKLHTFGQSLKNLENYPWLMNQYKELEALLKNGTVTTLEEANKKLLDFKNACAGAGVQVNSLADDILNGIADQLEYLVRAFVAGAIASKLREIYTNVVAIDSAMTELKKVTDATEQEYIRFMDNATERANKLGASVREIVNASADYARLGYSIDEASDLADSAIIYKNVGDGLEGIDQATEHLISTMKAFGIEAKDSMRIVDAFNEVANHFPTSAAGIGEGMQRSAAALASAGNSLEESVAIFTAAQSIAQDADVVGTSLKTMSMRIRSTKSDMEAAGEDTEGMANSVSQLRSEIQALTGVDIMLDDSTYKSTYQILDELAQVWDKLNDVTQANVLELLFGKRQANIGAGLLENFDIARDSLQTALDAEGSALRENEIFLESIQGHLNQLSAAWETFSYNFLDSDLVKGSVDFLTKIVNLLDGITNSFGALTTSVVTLMTVVSANSVLKIIFAWIKANKLSGIGKVIKSIGTAITGTLRAAQAGFGALAVKELGTTLKGIIANLPVAIKLFAAAVATVAALQTIKWANEYHDPDKLNEKLSGSIDKYKRITQEMESNTNAIESNANRIKELQQLKAEGTASIVDQDELKNLERNNELLEAQNKLLETQKALKSDELLSDAKKTYEKEWSWYAHYRGKNYEQGLRVNLENEKAWIDTHPDDLGAQARYEDYRVQALELRNQLWEVVALTGDETAKTYALAIDAALNGMLDGISEVFSNPRYSNVFSFMYDNANLNPQEMFGALAGEFGSQEVIVFKKYLEDQGYLWNDFCNYVTVTYGDTKDEVENNPITVDVDISEATDAVDKLSSSFKTLSNAFKEQTENGSLSIDTILDIIDAGYAAALEIDTETGKVRLNTEAYKILAKVKIQEQIASLQARRAEIITDLLGEAQAANTTAASYLTLVAANAAAAEAVKGIDAEIAALNKINVDSITQGVYGIGDAASSASSKLSSLLSGMNSLLSTTMDWLRQRYDDANDATKEWLESHKEALKKQLDDYNDLIDAQIKLLERQKEADDYAKKRKDKEKTVSDIENQLVAIENDDSIEAQKKRLELQEELAKAKDDLAEVQDDWNYDQRKQALEDEKQKYQDLIQVEIDAVQKRLDAVNEATMSEMDLRREAYDWITNREEELYQNLILWNREYGDGLDATIGNLFKDADGWRAYGATFKEALENLTRLVHDAQDAAGGIGSAFAQSAQVVIKSMDDLIAALLDRAKLLESVGQTASAAIYKRIADRLSNLKELGVELSEETSAKLFAVLENCDTETRQLVFNVISYLNGLKINGSEQFIELWQAFIDALTLADSALYNGGQNMIENLRTIFEALIQVRSLVDEVYRPTGQTAQTGIGKSGEILTPYAEGGVVDYTGPAMVHGKANSPEVVFNAAAASKLFNYVTRTPDLLAAAMAQGAGLLKGYGSASAYMISGSVGDININIAGNADSTTVAELKKVASGIKDDVIKTLNDSLKRRGIARSPRTV